MNTLQSKNPTEKALEDILASNPSLMETILGVEKGRINLIRRQEVLPTGRSDLVYRHKSKIILVELKVEEATSNHISQISKYIPFYEKKIKSEKLPDVKKLQPVLLCPEVPDEIKRKAENKNIYALEYDIEELLTKFRETTISKFKSLKISGIQTSVNKLYLINKKLNYIDDKSLVSLEKLANNYEKIGWKKSKNPKDRVRKFIKISNNLNLTKRIEEGITLTERGERYVEKMTDISQINDQQAELIRELFYSDPFSNELTFGMISLLDTIFDLSRNIHPVPKKKIKRPYAEKVGKLQNWNDTSRDMVVHMVGNYLEELGLIKKINKKYYLLPEGVKILCYYHIDRGKEMIKSFN